MKLNLTKKKVALIGGGILIASAIGTGSYFALNKKKADNDMFVMNIPKAEVKKQPQEQAPSVPASTPTPPARSRDAKSYSQEMARHDFQGVHGL
ncbi:hypothetical protein [Burkholderia cenocepacia]|uniref:hypothetical protein n=1 Tax=Burkholderia cenocepacia TaxID=95486 RepID=UPI001B9F3CF0|nr:hypothetical protein [Burkholderia cenocepacia]MBR8495134.1 hypothetical protein [Burkholderia cenocepacia]